MIRFMGKRLVRPCHECAHCSYDRFREMCWCTCPGVTRRSAKLEAKPVERVECSLARGTLACVLGERPRGEGER